MNVPLKTVVLNPGWKVIIGHPSNASDVNDRTMRDLQRDYLAWRSLDEAPFSVFYAVRAEMVERTKELKRGQLAGWWDAYRCGTPSFVMTHSNECFAYGYREGFTNFYQGCER